MIQQVRWNCFAECVEHRSPDVWDLLLELGDQVLDSHSLQVGLRSAKIARNYRKLTLRGVLSNVLLGTVSQRPNHRIATVSRTKLRRHRLQRPNIKQVQQ